MWTIAISKTRVLKGQSKVHICSKNYFFCLIHDLDSMVLFSSDFWSFFYGLLNAVWAKTFEYSVFSTAWTLPHLFASPAHKYLDLLTLNIFTIQVSQLGFKILQPCRASSLVSLYLPKWTYSFNTVPAWPTQSIYLWLKALPGALLSSTTYNGFQQNY